MRITFQISTFVFILSWIFPATVTVAQRGQPQSAEATAPVDLTGNWVSVVSEDWRHRMMTARKGDFESLPLNANGRQTANTWDLDQDNADGLQCKAFGVGGIIRQPGRLRISWMSEDTLQFEFDAGTQTRILPLRCIRRSAE